MCPVVDGGWSEWKNISGCIGPCGEGIQAHSRSCSNPPTSCGGQECNGTSLQFVTCNVSSCCPGL